MDKRGDFEGLDTRHRVGVAQYTRNHADSASLVKLLVPVLQV